MNDLKEIRARMGLSAAQMAMLLGLGDVANYYRLESGRRQLTQIQARALANIQFVYDMGAITKLLDTQVT